MKHIKKVSALLVATCMIFILAACGADVDTVLTIDDEFKGTRVITCTLSNSDLNSYVESGVTGLQSTIDKHLPSCMTYTLTQDTSNVIGVFTIVFDSLDDYKEKIKELLDLMETPIEAEIIFDNSDSLFKQGIKITENFDSIDLMEWLSLGIVEDGISSNSSTSDFFTSADTKVIFNSEEYETYSSIEVDEMQSYCMDSIEITTTPQNDGSFLREIAYTANSETVEKLGSELDIFMDTLVPDDGEIEMDADDYQTVWTISFSASDESELIKKTNTALKTDNTEFSMESSSNPNDPATMLVNITQRNDASYFCDYGGYSSPVTSTIKLDSSYSYNASETSAYSQAVTVNEGFDDDYVIVKTSLDTPDAYTVVMDRVVPFDRINVTTNLSASGGLERNISFAINKENAEIVGDSLKNLVEPNLEGVEFKTEETEIGVEYIVSIKADDASQMTSLMYQYIFGVSVDDDTSLEPTLSIKAGKLDSASLLKSAYYVEESLDLSPLLGSVSSTEGIEYTIKYPMLQRATSANGNEATFASNGASITVSSSSSGLSIFGLAVLLVLILSIIGLVLVLVLNRKNISRFFANRKALKSAQGTLIVDQPVADEQNKQVGAVTYQTLPDPQPGYITSEKQAEPQQENNGQYNPYGANTSVSPEQQVNKVYNDSMPNSANGQQVPEQQSYQRNSGSGQNSNFSNNNPSEPQQQAVQPESKDEGQDDEYEEELL